MNDVNARVVFRDLLRVSRALGIDVNARVVFRESRTRGAFRCLGINARVVFRHAPFTTPDSAGIPG